MARFEVEFLRTNVTVGQFLSYVRAQLKKRGLDELANGIDYDNFISGDWSCKVDHKERNDEAYVSLGVAYEEVKDMPYDKKSYQRKANGAISNEIVEFIFDDEKTGRGYYYAVEDEAESVESTADETTVAESEAESESVESVESVDSDENNSRDERAATNQTTKGADNLKTAREGYIMNAFAQRRWENITIGFKAIPLHGVNADAKITAALEAVQGKCKVRTIDADGIKTAIAQMEKFFGIPKCKLDGLRVVCDINAQNFPNAYRFVPESTIFSAENRKGKWYIVSIRRAPTYAPARAVQVCHMPEAMAEAIIARHTEFGI